MPGNTFKGESAYAYGLGVHLYHPRLGRAYGHSGWTPGYTGSMLYFLTSRTAVAFQTNTDRGGEPRDYLLELAEHAGLEREPGG